MLPFAELSVRDLRAIKESAERYGGFLGRAPEVAMAQVRRNRRSLEPLGTTSTPCHHAVVIARGHAVYYSFEDYLAHEEGSRAKHEYLDGQIYAMASGTPEHSALTMSIATSLAAQLAGGPCRVHSSDLRVRVLATGLATYPDVSVTRGPWEPDPASPTTVVNPKAIVEVLSHSTQAYDRGEKLEHYKQIPSLRLVVLAAHERRELEVWSRQEGGVWQRALNGVCQRALLPGIECALDVDQIYAAAAEPSG